jgi:hypothetical protein
MGRRRRLTGRGWQIGFRGRLHRLYIFPVGVMERALAWMVAPLLGAGTRDKIELIAPDRMTVLHARLPRALLPSHLGGDRADICALCWETLDPPPRAPKPSGPCSHWVQPDKSRLDRVTSPIRSAYRRLRRHF